MKGIKVSFLLRRSSISMKRVSAVCATRRASRLLARIVGSKTICILMDRHWEVNALPSHNPLAPAKECNFIDQG